MIQVLTRSAHPELYQRMVTSARKTAFGNVMFVSTPDDGLPKIVESYNLMAAVSTADILVFCHDDIIFLSEGWDERVKEAFRLGFEVVGAVGTQKYTGGMIFDSGKEYSVGQVVGNLDGKRIKKLFQHRAEIEPAQAVDGMFMAVTREHFIKSGGFDSQFDGLFYYDVDFCLRSNCAVVDILLAHEKPPHIWGKYPEAMKPIEFYRDAFNKKHGFKEDPPIGDQRCDSVAYEEEVAA